METQTNPGWRISFSIIVGVGWLIFFIIWLAFFASDYSVNKNIAIFLASLLIIFLLLGGVWAIWSLRFMPKDGWEMMKIVGFKWRITVSIVLPILSMIFLILWFYSYADRYTWYQNLAAFLVTLLVMGGVLGVIWARWGMKHGHEFEKFKDIGEEIEKKFEK
jgi:hypothetical protein